MGPGMNGPGELLPKDEGSHPIVTSDRPEPYGTETMLPATKGHVADIKDDPRLRFLSECSARIPSVLISRVLQDTMRVAKDTYESVKNGLVVAVELGLRALQSETSVLFEQKFRAWRRPVDSKNFQREVKLGASDTKVNVAATHVVIMGRKWGLLDYGDTIPVTSDGPINDIIGGGIAQRKQRLSTHLASGSVSKEVGCA